MKCYKCYCASIMLFYNELLVQIRCFLVLPKCYWKCYRKKSATFPKMVPTFLKTAPTFLKTAATFFKTALTISKKSPPFSEFSFALFSMSHFAPETA